MMGTDTKRLFRILAVANFFLYLGFNIWRSLFNNFAVEELGIRADQIGIIQSLREVPGLMGFVIGFLVLVLSEMRVMGLSVLLLGLGLVLTGWADNLSVFMMGTMVTSIGFHFFYPSNSGLLLMAVGKEEAPKMLGRLRSVAALASFIGLALAYILVAGVELGPISIPAWSYRKLLYMVGGVVIAGSLVAFRNGGDEGKQQEKRKVIFRRDYWLYYVLTFMMGSRRHIFTTFAIFMLVDIYGIDVRVTIALFLVNSLVSTFALAQLGKLVAYLGERAVLTFNFIGLIGVFLGYAYVAYLPVLYVLFVLDHIFFGFNLAVDSYFQKIAHSPEEITSNISLAQTINHVSALVVPVLGGILWEQISPTATFLAGVVIAVISLVLVQFIRIGPALEPQAVSLD
jgi:predicted MFS family arabinose efflux permease